MFVISRYTDLESRMKDEQMMAKIRDAEHAQHVAELMQKIGVLQMKVHRKFIYDSYLIDRS